MRKQWIGAVSLLGAAAAAQADIVLYQDDDFQDRSVATSGQIPDLKALQFNDQASSLVIRGERWTLCSDAGFKGQCVSLGPGRYASLGPGRYPTMGSWSGVDDLGRVDFNDRVSSIVIRWGRWELCSDAYFRGRCITLSPGQYANLNRWDFNDVLSSARPAGWMPSGY